MTNSPIVRMAAIMLLVAMVSHVVVADWSVAPVRGGRLGNQATRAHVGEVAAELEATWGNQKTLADHLNRHGKDFGSRSAQHYADQASDFLRSSQAQRLPTKIDADGIIRVYDPKTNTFGSFNPDGSTKTFFKPTRGADYWNSQPGVAPWEAPK
jgi:hypothetical protein